MVTYAKESGRKDTTIHREGSRIRYMLINGVRLGEIKRLLAPGTSLASLGAACNLPDQKSIFPFAKFVSLDFLAEPRLPPDAAAWASDLNPEKNPTQAEVDAAIALFEAKQFKSISDFLEFYLTLDCEVLQQSVVAMHKVYYDILQLSFVDSRRYTVSSFASCAAQTWLARRKRGANFVVNHQRLYSILKLSLRGGLTCVARTVCGTNADVASYVDLLEKQMDTGGEDGGPDVDLCQRVRASGLGLADYVTHCNAHLLPADGGIQSKPATTAVYADINRQVCFSSSSSSSSRVVESTHSVFFSFSLYAASGELQR